MHMIESWFDKLDPNDSQCFVTSSSTKYARLLTYIKDSTVFTVYSSPGEDQVLMFTGDFNTMTGPWLNVFNCSRIGS